MAPKKDQSNKKAKVQDGSHESHHEAHTLFRTHKSHNSPVSGNAKGPHKVPGVEVGAATGVIYIMDRAMANGYMPGSPNPEWCNFGQGAPEVGHIDGATPKPATLNFEELGGMDIHEYAPTAGFKPLREAVANYYNREFRKGNKIQYGAENVCIVPGGRAGLSRVASCLGRINLAYTVPAYSAYENTLSAFNSFVSIPNQTDEAHDYRMTPEQMDKEIRDRGLSAFLMSNPCNPTGTLIRDEELGRMVEVFRKRGATLITDEFYSWYDLEGPLGSAISAAEYVEDPNEDPIVLIDGLTKNWRCPGWRVCWVVGPKELVSALSAAGSYLDGGASHPMQCLAIQMLDEDRVKKDRLALQKHFRMKKDHCLKRLTEMGLEVKVPPQATFYMWVSLKNLPSPINSGLVFAEEALKEKVCVTPGIFFDINPSKRRNIVDSPCEKFIRLSFGPPLEELDRGLDGLARVIKKARDGHEDVGRNYKPHHDEQHHHNVHSAPSAGS